MQNDSDNNICMLYIYMGPFPWYFDFFLKSCENNGSIDFIIFTDNDISQYAKIKNIIFYNTTLQEVNQLFSSKLSLDINLQEAYKLCDFKPAFGYLLQDYIVKYDFWGVGDIDVIYGNIREILTDDILHNHDVFFVRDDYPTGFFQLYRNIYYINTLFKKSKDYKKVFAESEHYCFDECNFQFVRLINGISIFDCPAKIESLMHIIKKEQVDNKLKILFSFLATEGIPGKLTYTKENLVYNKKYLTILYHLISLKQSVFFKHPVWKSIPDTYIIGKYRFYKRSLADLIKYVFWEHIYYKLLLICRELRYNNLMLKPYYISETKARPIEGLYHYSSDLIYEVIFKNNNLYLRPNSDYIFQLKSYYFGKNKMLCTNLKSIIEIKWTPNGLILEQESINGIKITLKKIID